MTPSKERTLAEFVEDLQAGGRYTFTRAEAMGAGERSQVALEAALRRLRQRGRIASPRRGFYVLVPVEYREAGCTSSRWFFRSSPTGRPDQLPPVVAGSNST